MDDTRENRRGSVKTEITVLPGISDLLLGVPAADSRQVHTLHTRDIIPAVSSNRYVFTETERQFDSDSSQTHPSTSRGITPAVGCSNQQFHRNTNTAESWTTIRAPAPKRIALGGLRPHTLPVTPGQPPSPPYTAPSSACSTPVGAIDRPETALEDVLSQQDPDKILLADLVSNFLHGSVAPAYNQGWYRPQSPNNKFSHRLEAKVSAHTRDDLVREFFRRNEARQTYGEQVTIPRRPDQGKVGLDLSKKNITTQAECSRTIDCSPNESTRLLKYQGAREEHRELERSRRDRHRDLQMQSALRSCEIAADCGETHADEEKLVQGTRRTRAKGPGKDEQLYTAIYSHEFSARVVQSEHDGRKRAEKMVQLLLQYLVREQRPDLNAVRELCRRDIRSSSSTAHSEERHKRPRSDSEQS
ncbi:hypothetical protein A1O1_06419 [Capronia coronata CBS 617.96]|uniref:Uncharacterized protein n=1 Tax=Capronia coronata CBS 617.96 TaxID=1182541 RepID=W9Y8U2_9EURO|nr:uncharacterized protein A1O1_06419 [Capronia coronata CBS 617.96]EXJ86050.1 hypothetical protein A1O1_06419 [Capronia coronata CBS 617.96]